MIVVDGVSKTYAMTGWRIGWALAPAPLIKALDVVQGQSTTNPTAVAQHAAIAALKGPSDDFARIRAMFEKRRNAMVAGLSSIPGVKCRKPDGAFYAFADVRGLYGLDWNGKKIATDEDVAFWMLDKAARRRGPGQRLRRAGVRPFQLRGERGAHRGRLRGHPRGGRGGSLNRLARSRTVQV